jgi:hypothetical protein
MGLNAVLREAVTQHPDIRSWWGRFPSLRAEVETLSGGAQTVMLSKHSLWSGGCISSQIDASRAELSAAAMRAPPARQRLVVQVDAAEAHIGLSSLTNVRNLLIDLEAIVVFYMLDAVPSHGFGMVEHNQDCFELAQLPHQQKVIEMWKAPFSGASIFLLHPGGLAQELDAETVASATDCFAFVTRYASVPLQSPPLNCLNLSTISRKPHHAQFFT